MRRLLLALEWLLRHVVVYPFFRLVFHNRYSDERIDLLKVDKILILRFDRIGDMIVTTPIFKALKKQNTRIQIGVFTSPANAEIIRNNNTVDAIYVLHPSWLRLWKEILRARKERYTVVLNFIFNRTTSAGILANLVAPKGYKVGQGADKYKFYFNRLVKLERTELHMVEVLAYFIQTVFGFNISKEELSFDISIDQRSKMMVDSFLTKYRLVRRTEIQPAFKNYVVLNISATDAVRKISSKQVLSLAWRLLDDTKFSVVLIGAPAERDALQNVVGQVSSPNCRIFPEQGIASLLEIASLIEGAISVFTPDTSIIHFASATKTPVLGFFTPLQMAHEWVPYNVHHLAVYAPDGKPASEIPVEEIKAQVTKFLTTVESL